MQEHTSELSLGLHVPGHNKRYVKKPSAINKLIKLVKTHSAEAFSLGTFITHIGSFVLQSIQIKVKFWSEKVILLSEASHV